MYNSPNFSVSHFTREIRTPVYFSLARQQH
jgi:hypothetical protein